MPDEPKPSTKLTPSTPLPWTLTSDGLRIIDDHGGLITRISPSMDMSPGMGSCMKNMAYIVHAANSLPALQAENERLKEFIRDLDFFCETNDSDTEDMRCGECYECKMSARRAALGEPK